VSVRTLLPGLDRRDLGYLLPLAAAVFIAEALLAHEWFRVGAFSQFNVIFDDDPNAWLQRFAHGRSIGGFTHPLLSLYFTPGFRAASRVGSLLGLVQDEAAFRQAAALYVAPACAAIKTGTVFVIFRLLSLNAPRAAVAAALSAAAFSSVVFGASSSHYAVSGCLLALVSLLPLLAWERVGRVAHAAVWLVASVLSIGTTVSNVVHIGSVRFSAALARHGRPALALATAALYGAVGMALTLSLNRLVWELRAPAGDVSVAANVADSVERNIGLYTPSRAEQAMKVASFPVLLGRAFVATPPIEKPNASAARNNSRIPFELSYDGAPLSSFLVGLGVIAALSVAGGAGRAVRAGGRWRAMALGWLMSFAVFGILYSGFGLNGFLYSQYWQLPASLLLGAWLIPGRMAQARVIAAGVALIMVMIVADAVVLSRVTERMRSPGPPSSSMSESSR
jgi:hypothetical protein